MRRETKYGIAGAVGSVAVFLMGLAAIVFGGYIVAIGIGLIFVGISGYFTGVNIYEEFCSRKKKSVKHEN